MLHIFSCSPTQADPPAPAALPRRCAVPCEQAENQAVTRGLNKYIRRKKYDDIEYYLPPLLAARGQLIRSGYLLGEFWYCHPSLHWEAGSAWRVIWSF